MKLVVKKVKILKMKNIQNLFIQNLRIIIILYIKKNIKLINNFELTDELEKYEEERERIDNYYREERNKIILEKEQMEKFYKEKEQKLEAKCKKEIEIIEKGFKQNVIKLRNSG